MKHKVTISTLLLVALFLTLAPIAFASTTWYVDGVYGNDANTCKSTKTTACKTIGHAIALASSGDSIMVAAATYGENLTISKSLKIIGSSSSPTIIDGGSAYTVVTIPNTSASVILSRMTIRNGNGEAGGGVLNSGTLTINKTTISGNLARSGFTRIPVPIFFGGDGGGIYNDGRLTINNSSISGNVAQPPPPWAPCGQHNVFCAPSVGGGIDNHGTLNINNSTVSGNGARIGGGIGGPATFQNSIVANSFSGGNCSVAMTSKGYNLSSDNTCNFNNIGDLNHTDPMLGPLQYNFGPTQTMALPTGSPAIDAGNPNGCTDGQGHLLTTDQRGKPRPNTEDRTTTNTGRCDMGAFERQSD